MITVFDTNIWISAFLFGGVPDSILREAILRKQIAASTYIEEEIVRVMAEKFGHDELSVRMKLRDSLKDAVMIRVTGEIRGVCRDPKDDAILETAWKANADYLVTGDKDLLRLMEFHGTKILTPVEYLGLV